MSWYKKLTTLRSVLQQVLALKQGLVYQPVYVHNDAIPHFELS